MPPMGGFGYWQEFSAAINAKNCRWGLKTAILKDLLLLHKKQIQIDTLNVEFNFFVNLERIQIYGTLFTNKLLQKTN
jgi:hypothetical protein